MFWFKKNWPLLLILTTAFILRFINLGYSDFQGDEIKALFIPEAGQSVGRFLMDQRKGPMQFFVTAVVKVFDPTYTHHFFDRLPFALAGFLAVFFFYKFVEVHFGKKIAIYSGLFLATNGFFIAFSRLIQYQSFVILFMILALYMFSLSTVSEKWKNKGLYLGFIFWAISILSHYDGVFIAPFALYLLWPRIKDKHLWFSMIISGIMLAAFYIPFVFSISSETKLYWEGRLEGVGGKISSSRYLFEVYQPIYAIHIYTIFGFLGLIALLIGFIRSLNTKLFSQEAKERFYKHLFLILWVAAPVLFFEVIVSIPGTHIFTYLVPLIIVAAVGISFLEETTVKYANFICKKTHCYFSKNSSKYLAFVLIIIFTFLSLQSYTIYVDHQGEYPWATNKKFLIFILPRPITTYHLSLFGFPYYRHWDEVKKLVLSTPNNGYYSTNERVTIARYYVPLTKEGDHIGFYIYIDDPQSFITEIDNDKASRWIKTNPPIKVYYDSLGKEITKVYYVD